MTEPQVSPPRRRMSLKRRLQIGSVVLVIGLIALVVALPTLLGTWPGRKLLVRVVNGRLAPAQLQLGGVRLSWTQPIELSDVALITAKGKMVVSARKVRVDQGLLALIRSKGDYGIVKVDDAMLDVERRADGSIDVLEALAGLTSPDDPKKTDKDKTDPSVIVTVGGRRFSLKTPEVPCAIVAEAFQAGLTVAPGKPAKLTVTLKDKGQTLDLQATYDHRAPAGTAPNMGATATSKGWSVAVDTAGLAARGQFVGELEASRQNGLWKASSEAELRDAVVAGALLSGDRLALSRVTLGCDVAEAKTGWKVHAFHVQSPVASLKASGSVPASPQMPTRLEGHADLAALARMLPHVIPLREGLTLQTANARVEADLVSVDGSDRLQATASLADLSGSDHGRALALRDPATLSTAVTRTKGVVAIERFSLRAAGIDATATGDLDRGVILSGTADLAVAESQVREWLDLGATNVAGKARFKADYRHKGTVYEARFAAEVVNLALAGLTAEPIARDHIRLEGTADGPGNPMGVPTGWHKGRVAVVGNDTRLDLNATTDDTGLTVAAGVALPLTSPIPSRAEASVAFRRPKTATGAVQEIDQLRLVLTPADPANASARVALDVRGRLDLAAGELTLTPLTAPEPAAAVALSPEGIKITGFTLPGRPVAISAALAGELGSLDRVLQVWTGAAPHALGGHWATVLTANRGLDGVCFFDGRFNVDHLIATTPRGPIALGFKGGYVPKDDYLHLETLDLSSRFGRFVVGGNIARITGDRIIDVKGLIEPRWEGLDKMVASAIEPNAQIRGTGRPFQLAGPASGSASQILRTLTGEIGLDLKSARAFGLTLGATPVVLRLGGGKAVFDPIRAPLNDGVVDLVMDLVLDDPNVLSLRVAKGSKIDGATINETVSHDILSYIAPVLSQATQVRGKVSLAIDGAEVPIVGNGLVQANAQARFDKVIFQPGAFATELFSLTSMATPKMVLDQTLQILIADGRVNQSGLAIGIGGDSKIQIDGSVGLDKTLALRAAMPVTSRMLGRDKTLNQIVGDTKITVPIGGTLSRPAIDKGAFQVALRDAAKSMVRRGVRNELGNALDQVLPGAGSAVNGGAGAGAGNGAGTGTGNGARPGRPGSLLGGDGLKILEGVGRELIDPKKKP